MQHNRGVALEFSAAVRRIPSYPAAAGYAQTGPVTLLASNESPYPPLAEVVVHLIDLGARRSAFDKRRDRELDLPSFQQCPVTRNHRADQIADERK